ncbi:hypothetical protein BP5796_06803 [Coleophoma crateriformis]|uniref:FAR-17a/AIG1-like protein n=1 Tax=Coleophoma crateriformis TaxID=565419 RepID=A0A3D8RPG5_9HELO|nr:hypothetical protein BP5796_06803 [Coleophoma crateriformis]
MFSKPKFDKASFAQAFKLGNELWDPSNRFETSWLLPPWVLFGCRAAFALYAFVTLLFSIGWEGTHPELGGWVEVRLSFSYFTILCYWGMANYFLISSIHTFSYAINGGTPLLNRFPRSLQALHHLYATTVTTFPFLVTIIYWGAIYAGPWFPIQFNAWANISEHAMNSAWALFEITMSRMNPPPWVHLVWLIVILACYLALAYITYYTKGVYVYTFLDTSNGKSGIVTAYCFGIAIAICIIFCLVKGLYTLRKRLTEQKLGKMGKFYAGRDIGAGEVELESQRMWEK